MGKEKQFYDMGLRAEKEGKTKEALKNYRASVRENAGFRPAFNNLGAIYSKAKRPDLAIAFYNRALELGEDDIVHFNLGSEYYRLEMFKDSERHLIASVKLNRRLLKSHILLAYIYRQKEDFTRSDNYFQNAIKIDPGHRAAALGFAVSLSDRNLAEKALEVVEKYLKIVPNDVGLKNLHAGLLLKLNRYEESLNELTSLTKTSASYRSFTDHLAEARKESAQEYGKMFDDIDHKIKEKTERLRKKIENRKNLLKTENRAEKSNTPNSEDEKNQDMKDMVDLSFLHLFNGDTEKALKFLLQARKMKKTTEKPSP